MGTISEDRMAQEIVQLKADLEKAHDALRKVTSALAEKLIEHDQNSRALDSLEKMAKGSGLVYSLAEQHAIISIKGRDKLIEEQRKYIEILDGVWALCDDILKRDTAPPAVSSRIRGMRDFSITIRGNLSKMQNSILQRDREQAEVLQDAMEQVRNIAPR